LITAAHFQRAVRALGRWLWMDASPGTQAVLVLALAAVAWRFGTHLHARRNVPTHNQAGHPDSPDPITRTVATLILAYFLFLALVISFHDSTFALDERMLSPILPWSLIAFVCIGHRLTLDRIRASTIYALFAFVALWFAAAQVSRGVPWLMAAHSDGQGYASRQWRESELLARVRALPPKARIFSNAYDAIYLVTGRFADALPQNTVLGTTQVNQHYVDELARMHYWLVKSGGVIVYFSNLEAPTGMASPAELEKMMRLQLLYNAADGAIYGIRE
jgi:hypothetical protein